MLERIPAASIIKYARKGNLDRVIIRTRGRKVVKGGLGSFRGVINCDSANPVVVEVTN